MHQISWTTSDNPNLLNRLDARVKVVLCLTLLVMVISCGRTAFPLIVAGAATGVALAAGLRPRLLALRYAQPMVIVFMVIVLKLFFSGHQPLFTTHIAGMEITGYRDGLLAGLQVGVRVAGAVSLVAALGCTTPFTEVMAALAWLKVPRGLIEIALFAWRYLFVLLDEATVVYNAQKNRLGYAGYRRGARSFGTLAGTLVIKAFDNSQTITTAMIQRGYDGTIPLLMHRPFRPAEVMGAATVIAVFGAMWPL